MKKEREMLVMKRVALMVLGLAVALQAATNYIVVDDGISLTSVDGKTLFVGAPAKIISNEGDNVVVEIEGFVNPAKSDTLYASKSFVVELAKGDLAINGEKGVLKATLPKDNIDEDDEYAWGPSADMFYEKCTQCHAAPAINTHTMLEWEGLFSSMKQFAQPSAREEATILRFLRTFAKDGFGTIAW